MKTSIQSLILLLISLLINIQIAGQSVYHSIGKAPLADAEQVEYSAGYKTNAAPNFAYGLEAFTSSWISFPFPDATPFNTIASFSEYFQGGDFAGDGFFYATGAATLQLYKIDAEIGSYTIVGNITGVSGGQTITSLGYDLSKGTMYLGSTNASFSELYTINLLTAEATLIGQINNCPGLIAIAVNSEGDIYGVDIIADNLIKIDPLTAAGTIVGWIGFDLNYAQDADFDMTTGILYLSAYSSEGQLLTADLSTGAATLVYSWGQTELTAFGIDNDIFIPVELTSFTAQTTDNTITLNWSTASETNNSGFEIERNSGNGFVTVGFVQGSGTTTNIKNYSFTDKDLLSGVYSYRLKQVDFNGTFEFSNEIEILVMPAQFSLDHNFPNPFNPSTVINFSLAIDSKVALRVFNILGQEILTLLDQNLPAGFHSYQFDGSKLNSGVYLYQLEANGVDGQDFKSIRKMMLTK